MEAFVLIMSYVGVLLIGCIISPTGFYLALKRWEKTQSRGLQKIIDDSNDRRLDEPFVPHPGNILK